MTENEESLSQNTRTKLKHFGQSNSQMIRDIVDNAFDLKEIARTLAELPQPEFCTAQEGLRTSKIACEQPRTVPVTPYMQNALKLHDNFKSGQKLECGAPQTKAERIIYSELVDELGKRIGPRSVDWPSRTEVSIVDYQYYVVDCWRNLKENMRDIVPGQAEQRRDVLEQFTQPISECNFWDDMLKHPNGATATALKIFLARYPIVRATKEPQEMVMAFQKKATNVC